MSTVIDSFKEHGLDYLIPPDADQYDLLFLQDDCDDFNFGYDNKLPASFYDGYRDYSDSFFSDYEKDVFELADEEDRCSSDEGNPYKQETPSSLQSLKDIFDVSYMSDIDFLNMNAGELFGITNVQLKFIDVDILQNIGVPLFLDIFRKKEVVKNIPDVEQRIKYSLVVGFVRADQIRLPQDICSKEDKEKLFPYIKKIALEKDVQTACNRLSLYRDYISFYKDALAMNAERAENNGPVFSYSLFPKISHLKDLHDKAMRDNMEMTTRREGQRIKELDHNIKEYCETSEYKKFLVKKEKYSVVPVDGYYPLDKEGKDLNHCVVSYAAALATGQTNIYFLRKNSQLDIPFYTAEVQYQSEWKRYVLMQCYGENNTTEKSDEFCKFIIDWTKEKNIKIGCIL